MKIYKSSAILEKVLSFLTENMASYIEPGLALNSGLASNSWVTFFTFLHYGSIFLGGS